MLVLNFSADDPLQMVKSERHLDRKGINWGFKERNQERQENVTAAPGPEPSPEPVGTTAKAKSSASLLNGLVQMNIISLVMLRN